MDDMLMADIIIRHLSGLTQHNTQLLVGSSEELIENMGSGQ